MSNFPSLWRSERNDLFRALQREMDKLAGQFAELDWGPGPLPRASMAPACDVEETENAYLLSMDLPGLSKNDVKIELNNGQLRVYGERKEERHDSKKPPTRTERYFGSFERIMTIPADTRADLVEASFENGVLRIAIPKAEAAKTKQIPIGEGKGGFFAKLIGKKEPPGPSSNGANKEKVA